MSLRVLCKDHPQRSIALVTKDGHVLTLEYSPTLSESVLSSGSYFNVVPPRCIVKFSSTFSGRSQDYRLLGTGYGTLGLLTLNSDVFLCVIANSLRIASPRPNETVQRIENVEFYCLNRPDYDSIQGFYEDTNPYGQQSEEGDYGSAFQGRDIVTENPFLALKKLLSDGSFYYSTDFNLTHRLQDRVDEVAFDIERLDESFLWNSYMVGPLLQFRGQLADHERQLFDSSQLLTLVIRGFVQSFSVSASPPFFKTDRSNVPSVLTLVSRLSSRRAGTRFNSRGIDDDGQVSNFVETETIFWMPPGLTFSYTQVRGSVPIFWEQAPGLIPGQQKIQVTRSVGATQHAFDKHFEYLQLDYGAAHVINLLSETKPGEVELSDRYRYHMRQSPLRKAREEGTSSDHHLLRWTDFDFHAETRGPAGYENAKLIEHRLGPSTDGFAYFLSEDPDRSATLLPDTISEKSKVILQQEGVFRTNCLDCLDRTNLVQTMISRMALERFFVQNNGTPNADFWRRHSTLWADNGDVLSKVYAGTGALKSSFTRHGKMSLAGAIADARKSMTRLYVNNFTDNAKQNTIDVLLGSMTGQAAVHLYDPVNDLARAELAEHSSEFSSTTTVRIWAGTFNVNGRPYDAGEDLGSWLTGHFAKCPEEPTIIAVGFQEIVDLSPQQIMSTDPGSRKVWEQAVKKTLDRETTRRGTQEYVLLRSGQLVGAALLLFVKADVLRGIKNVEGSVKKTGLSGIAGNKGGCAIRLEYSNTRICFITAHLAAGHSNVDERNRDYSTIAHGLRFQRNRTIKDHDAIIWLGDFNYRIGLDDARVRSSIETGNLNSLYEHDQLHLEMVAGHAFQSYSEGPLTFPPTYRYNNGTDVYDTSEKRRIPAWCDRILWKGETLRQLEYYTAPLKFSDHRPVYAIFECIIQTIDQDMKERLSRELYEKYKETVEAALSESKYEHDTRGASARGSSAVTSLPVSSGCRLPVMPPMSPSDAIDRRKIINPTIMTAAERDWTHITQKGESNTSLSRAQGHGALRKHLSSNATIQPSGNDTLLDLGVMRTEELSTTGSGETSLPSQPAMTSEAPKKKGPPVPRKPIALAASQSFRSPHDTRPQDAMTARAGTGERKNAAHNTDQPSHPRRVMGERPTFAYQSRGTPSPAPLALPRNLDRERQHSTRQGTDSSELLDSDVDMGMCKWTPLQPAKEA